MVAVSLCNACVIDLPANRIEDPNYSLEFELIELYGVDPYE